MMKARLIRRTSLGLAVAAGATALVLVAASPALAGPIFCGGARALTPDVAIASALDDAGISAQSEGFYGACKLVGSPEIFESYSDPYFGHVYFAQVQVTCAA